MITTKSDGTKIVHQGYGTVGKRWFIRDRKAVMEMSQIPMTNMGATHYDAPNAHEVELTFCNVDSIDLFIVALESMKSMLRRNTL